MREGFFAHPRAEVDDDHQRKQQTQGCRRLDPTGVVAAPTGRRMFSNVNRRAAVLTAKCQALQHAQRDQQHGSDPADSRIARQQTDEERRRTHDQNCNEEGRLAADQIAETPEEQGAERAHQEAGGECQQREDAARIDVERGEKLRADDAS